MNKEIKNIDTKQLRKNAITKRLNFLIGSGVSVPAIPLMGVFQKEGVSVDVANKELKNRVKDASQLLINFGNTFHGFLSECEREKVLYEREYWIKLYKEYYPKKYDYEHNITPVLNNYVDFIVTIIDLLYISNSRQTPKSVNIFTTNYDLFLEKAIDEVMKTESVVFNDGANGYFDRILNSANYNKTVAYRGLNDSYINELPSISLIKPHGSMNWERLSEEKIAIRQHIVDNPVIVKPTGYESQKTFLNNHFYEMLRAFQLELDKPQSVLFVIGFSFQDKHIAKMVTRALKNPELIIYVFGFSDEDKTTYLSNLGLSSIPRNLKIIIPSDLEDEFKNENKSSNDKTWYSFTLANLIELLKHDFSDSSED